jgi:serine/threonine protein kinase
MSVNQVLDHQRLSPAVLQTYFSPPYSIKEQRWAIKIAKQVKDFFKNKQDHALPSIHHFNSESVSVEFFLKGNTVTFIEDRPEKTEGNKVISNGFWSDGSDVRAVKILLTKIPSARDDEELALLRQFHAKPGFPILVDSFSLNGRLVRMEVPCKGGTLEQLISRHIHQQQPLSATDIAFIAYQMLRIVNTLHGKGLVHRDIQPENFQLREEGRNDLSMTLCGGFPLACPANKPPQNGAFPMLIEYASPEIADLYLRTRLLKRQQEDLSSSVPLQELQKREEALELRAGEVSGFEMDHFAVGCVLVDLLNHPILNKHLSRKLPLSDEIRSSLGGSASIVELFSRSQLYSAPLDCVYSDRVKALAAHPPQKRGVLEEKQPPSPGNERLMRLACGLIHPDPSRRLTAREAFARNLLREDLAASPALRRALEKELLTIDQLFQDLFGNHLEEEHRLALESAFAGETCSQLSSPLAERQSGASREGGSAVEFPLTGSPASQVSVSPARDRLADPVGSPVGVRGVRRMRSVTFL